MVTLFIGIAIGAVVVVVSQKAYAFVSKQVKSAEDKAKSVIPKV